MNCLVIIPTFNESDHIEPLIRSIASLHIPFDILFIDDHSPDGTSEKIRYFINLNTFSTRIHLIERPGKLGLGSAYRDGFAWALSKNYDLICQMDADFSHDPNILTDFVEASKKADVVLGSRYIPEGQTLGWPFHRLMLSRFANVYAKTMTGSCVSDLTGGFKCYKKEVLKSITKLPIDAEGYAFQIQTTFFAEKLGFHVLEIPITFKDREKGKSKLSRRVVWEAFFAVLKLSLQKLKSI